MKINRSLKIHCWLMAACVSAACRSHGDHESYTVIARTNNDSELHFYVPIVLQGRSGYKYYVRCNDNKAGEKGATLRCNLHVGMQIDCQVFGNRDLGYDLICGTKRNERGKLDSYGENELLLIDKEEN